MNRGFTYDRTMYMTFFLFVSAGGVEPPTSVPNETGLQKVVLERKKTKCPLQTRIVPFLKAGVGTIKQRLACLVLFLELNIQRKRTGSFLSQSWV